MSNPSHRPHNRVALIILAVALLGGAVLRFDAAPRLFSATTYAGGDVSRYYVSTAESFLAGEGWTPSYESNYIPPPLQSVFIVAMKLVFPGGDYGTLRYAQAVLSVVTIGLVFLVGCLMSGRLTGALAALLIAIDPDAIGYAGSLLAENNYFFLLFLFLAVLLRALLKDGLILSGLSGVLLGLTSLMKPFPMLLVGLIPVWLVCRYRDRRHALLAFAMAGAFVLVVYPWTIRNVVKYGALYPISTNSGILLAQSNFSRLNPADEKMLYWDDIYKTDLWQDKTIDERFRGRVDKYGKAEWNLKDRAYRDHAFGYIARNPVHFLRNYGIKIYNVFRYPASEVEAPYRYTGLGSNWPFPAFRHVLVLVGLAGAVMFGIRTWRKPEFVMIVVLLYYVAFTALLHITKSGRMNLPMKLLLNLFAAYLLSILLQLVMDRFAFRARVPKRQSVSSIRLDSSSATQGDDGQ